MGLQRQAGFTLIELMVTVAVLAILLSLGLPGFQGVLRSNRVATTNNELIASLSLARTEALRNGRGAGVCPSTAGTACDGGWNDGWMVWSDADGNGSFESTETVLRFFAPKNNMEVTSSAAGAVLFDARGRRRSAAQTISARPDECGGQPLRRTLTINASGQVVSAKGTCS